MIIFRDIVLKIASERALGMKVLACHTQIRFIQRRFRLNRLALEARVEVLINYWHKLNGQLQARAMKLEDERTRELLTKIILVPQDIQRAVLSKFVQKCKELHIIAFFQWRNLFPNALSFNKHEVEETIRKGMSTLYDTMNPDQAPTAETMFWTSPLDSTFMTNYSDLTKDSLHFGNITSFSQIGMSDPYRGEDRKTRARRASMIFDGSTCNITDLVYPKSKYVLEGSPKCSYIPTKAVMFKMMRACVEVQAIEDIWFYR